jgi:hypothetical protein
MDFSDMDDRPIAFGNAPVSTRRWFWTTLAVGAVMPAVGMLGFTLVYLIRARDWPEFGFVIVMLLAGEILTLCPFLILALIARYRLRARHKTSAAAHDLAHTILTLWGTIVFAAIPYALYWLLLVPLVASAASTTGQYDWGWFGRALGAYLTLILPFASLILAAIGYPLGFFVATIQTASKS